MRKFESDSFNHDLAEALTSSHITTETREQKNVLSYLKQFVYLTSGRSKLYYGYLTEAQLDTLIEIRDNNSNRQFSRAVEALGVEGEVSSDCSRASPLKLEIENTRANIEKLDELYYEVDTAETKKILRSLQDVIRNTHPQAKGTIEYYAPAEDIQNILFSDIFN